MDTEFSHRRDVGHETFVMGMVYGIGKGQKQPRHQEEHREQAHQDSLRQHDAHIVANAELHEHHGHHAGHRGQRAGGNLRNGLAQGHDHGLPGVLVLMLLHETMAEDDGIVHGQRQLQHHGDGIRDKADGAEPVIRPLVQDGRHDEGHQEHGNLRVCSGSEQQHRHDDHPGQQQYYSHVIIQIPRVPLLLADIGRIVHIISGQGIQNRVQILQGALILRRPVEGDLQQRLTVMVILRRVLKIQHADPVHLPNLLRKPLRLLKCHVAHHDPGSAVCDELLLHQVKPLPGLRGVRQIRGQIVVDLYLIHGKHAVENQQNKNQIESFPLIHNQGGQLHHERILLFLLFHLNSLTFPVVRHMAP